MPTLLDERSPARRPILFGRALVAAQNAEQDAIKNQIAEQRERRLMQREAQIDARQARVLQLQEKQQQLKEQMFDAKLGAAEMQLNNEKRQLSQFSNASKMIGKLNPRSENYDAEVGEIIANNPEVFADTGNNFTSIIKSQMETIQKARNSYLEGRSIEDQAVTKLETESGVPAPIDPTTGRKSARLLREQLEGAKGEYAEMTGMKPKSVSVGGVEYTQPPDETKPMRQDRAFYATEAQRIRSLAGRAVDPDIQKELIGRASEFESRASQVDQQIQSGTAPVPTQPALDPERAKRLEALRGQYQPK